VEAAEWLQHSDKSGPAPSCRLLAERAGLQLSSASVSALFTKEPSQIKQPRSCNWPPPTTSRSASEKWSTPPS
jgi:hypothetical protein